MTTRRREVLCHGRAEKRLFGLRGKGTEAQQRKAVLNRVHKKKVNDRVMQDGNERKGEGEKSAYGAEATRSEPLSLCHRRLVPCWRDHPMYFSGAAFF